MSLSAIMDERGTWSNVVFECHISFPGSWLSLAFQQAQNPIFSACNTHAKLVLGKATRFASIRFELYILAPDSVVGLIEPYASIQYYV